jgi:signal transduction histidine kinase/CheY-like chemotaxis protein/HAMP domain-containing protein
VCSSDLSDYEYVVQDGEKAPMGHLVKAIRDKSGETAGFIAVRLDAEGLSRVVDAHPEPGQTFDIFLCGMDGKLRTDTGKREIHKALTPWNISIGGLPGSRNGEAQAHSGFQKYTTKEGIPVLWVQTPVVVYGVTFMVVAEMEERDVYAVKDRIWMALFLLSALLTVLMTGVAAAVAGRITQPVTSMGEWAEKVATGDLTLRDIPCTDDEMGRFVHSFRRVVEFLKDMARLAMDLGEGNYSTVIEPRSANDELGASLKRMTESLKDAARAMEALAAGDFHAQVKVKGPNDLFARSLNSMVERIRETHEQGRIQARQKSLQAELNEIMRGDKTVEEFSRHVLSFLCICFKAALGAFYIRDEDGGTLKLYSGFALSAHRPLPLAVQPGEGLVGQAMLEKRRIVFSDCPDHFLSAQTLVGDVRLSSVLAFPFVRENRVEGVVELGIHGKFAERDLDFLDLISESVAIAIFSSVSRLKMKELLDKTVKQSDDLRLKQQELNLINQDLKDQAEKLSMSERQLMAKEDELTRINMALEERSLFLEQQKDAVREKNQELEKAQAELIEKSERLENISRHKSEFMANMSHELRTPLNSILLISRLMEENRQGNLNPRQIEFAQTIHSAGLDLLNLIDDILDLSRIEAGRLELVPIQVRVSDLERKIRLNFEDICREKGIALLTDIRPDTPENLFVDLKRIDQVLKNLVSNAVKFTSSGHVNVVFSVLESFPPGFREKGDVSRVLKVSVEDTGPGIPADRQSVVFDAFCQADGTIGKKFGGTGLGLSISRELVRLMGGEITLDSVEGSGSTFVVFIPDVFGKGEGRPEIRPVEVRADKGEVEDDVLSPRVEPSMELKGRKILIVDVDMRNVYALLHCFENEDMKILVGKSGRNCLEILERENDVELVIMDLLMPDMEGLEAMEIIRSDERFRHIPVIALTARAMKGDREKCLAAGAAEYVSKPVELDRLVSIMKDLLRRTPENAINDIG